MAIHSSALVLSGSVTYESGSSELVAPVYDQTPRYNPSTGSLYYDLETGCLSEVKAEVQDDF